MADRGGFDPCRAWLGIAAVDLADPFRAIGVPADVADPEIVRTAAENRLARLRGVDPGPFRMAHGAIVRRIEACRDEVLAAVAARGPGAAPPPTGFVPPPSPVVAAVDPVPQAPPSAPEDEFDVIRIDRSRRVRRATPSPLPAVLSLLALIAAGVAVYTLWPRLPLRHQIESIADVFTDGEADAPAASRPDAAGTGRNSPAAPAPSADDLAARGAAPATGLETAQPFPPSSVPPEEDLPPRTAPPPVTEPPAVGDPADAARTATDVEPLLEAAYDAIRRNAFDEADEQVAAAARLAAADEALASRVRGWKEFASLARQAALYRERALDAAHSGGDYDVGGQRIAIVESTAERFVYRKAGRNVEIRPRDKVPGPVVTAILKAWFARRDRPSNQVLMGAHLVARVEPNLRLAADAWDRAGRGGEDVSLLEPLLNDPIIRNAATR
jgi:hypothetical protein